jgi:histidinol-phosphatase (PHP family)
LSKKEQNITLKIMVKSNFHMHTTFCDGKNCPEDYVLAALNKGMESIGFSTHVPISMENIWNMKAEMTEHYFKEILRLKQKYAKQIEIYAGFEMDYLATENKNTIMQYIAQADYTIGSVHYIYDEKNAKYYSADGSAEDLATTFEEIGKGNNQACVAAYYQALVKAIHEFKPDIVGHLDIIKKRNKNNLYFNENETWYINLINSVLDEIALSGAIIEVNTGGILRDFVTETYPSIWVLKECHKRKIPIIISSDAHKAEDIDGYFIETVEKLQKIGFTCQKIFKAGKWVDAEL